MQASESRASGAIGSEGAAAEREGSPLWSQAGRDGSDEGNGFRGTRSSPSCAPRTFRCCCTGM